MSAQPPSNQNPVDELKTDLQESPPLDELKAGLSDTQPLVQNAQPRYSFGWFDKWLLAIPIAIGLIICFLLWTFITGTPPPTTTTLHTPAPDTTLQVGEPLTITGTAPPNSTVQIYNHGQLVAETTADENGNFMVRFEPVQPGTYELTAVATVNGEPLESPPIQFVIAEESGQTALQPTSALTQTAIAAGTTTATGTEGGAQGAGQGATTPGATGGAQGAGTPGAEGGTSAPTTVTLQAPAPDATLQAGESLTISGSAPPNSTVQIYNQGQLVAEATADANGNFVVSVAPGQAGTYQLTAVATTPDGTTLESPPMQFVIAEATGQTTPGAEDATSAPTTVTVQAPAADATLQAGESLTITGTAPPNSTIQIYHDGQLVAETTADANGNFVVSVAPGQVGAYELTAVATMPDGTTLESPPTQFVIAEESGGTTAPGQTAPADQTTIASAGATATSVAAAANGTTVPSSDSGTQGGAQGATTPGAEGGTTAPTTASLQAPPPDATLQAGESLTITGSAPPNSTVQIYNQGQLVAEATADANGNFVVSVVPDQAGTYELTAVATAPDGTTLESPPIQFVIAEGSSAPGAAGETPAPTTASLQTPAPDAALQEGQSLTITGSAPPNSTVQIYNGDQLVAETTADANGNFVVSIVPDQAGTFELSAVATTPDGTTLESPPIEFVIAEESAQTPIAGAGATTTSVAAAANGTPVPGAEGSAQAGATPGAGGGAQGATTPGAEGGAQGGLQGTTTPGAEGGAQGSTIPGAEDETSAPTTASLQAPPSDATLQAGESLTITGSAPPNSTVQIYHDGQVVAEATADANGNFVVSVVPDQAGTYELSAVATAPDGTTLESPPLQFVVAEGSSAPGAAGETPAPTTASLQAPAADAALQAGASVTITGSAPPNSTVQIYNQGQLVAEATADADGNFVVSIVPNQAGAFELTAVATTPDGTTLESPPIQFVIAEESEQTPIASADQTVTAVAAAANGTLVPGSDGSSQGGAQAPTTPGAEGGAQSAATPGAEGSTQGGVQGGAQGATTPSAEGNAQGGAQGATTPGAEGGAQGGAQGTTTPGAEGSAQGGTAAQTPGAAGAQGAPPAANVMPGQGLTAGTPISGTGVPGSVVTVYMNDSEIGTATVAADGTWEFILPIDLAPGEYTLRITSTSAGGSTGTTESVTESQEVRVTVVGMTLPVTGKSHPRRWSNWRHCWHR